jgi:kumamolisin
MPQSVIIANHTISSNAVSVIPLDESTVLPITVMLRRPVHPDGLTVEQYAEKVINGELPPLDRATYRAHFTVSDSDIAAVLAFASANRLELDYHYATGATVHLTGTVKHINSAFGITLQTVTDGGSTYTSFNGSVSLPIELSDIVVGVLGLEESAIVSRNASNPGRILSPTNSEVTSLATAAKAYGTPWPQGGGQTVAIIELGGGYTNTNLQDSFRANGIDGVTIPFPNVRAKTVTGAAGNNPTGGDLSTNLEVVGDIVAVGAAAPSANIIVYFAKDYQPSSVVSIWQRILNDAISGTESINIISYSYGASEQYLGSTLPQLDGIISSLVTLGITICASTGDYGPWPYDPSGPNAAYSTYGYPNYPASNPGVLAVGGTILQLDPITGAFGNEYAWNQLTAAGGGGVSRRFSVPTYQNSGIFITTNPSGSATGASGRAIPDISAHADPSCVISVYDSTNNNPSALYYFGGTSVAAPLVAGMIAGLNSMVGGSIGAPQNLLYNKADRYIRDVTVGNSNIRVGGTYGGGYEATTGWDAVTGLGSINFNAVYYDYVTSTLTNITVATTLSQQLTLIPSFDPTNLSYGVNVDNSVTSVIITPTAPVPTQTILVGGQTAISGQAITIDGLTVGPFNAIPVTVTSFNGQFSSNYVININRAAQLPNDATLSDLYFAATTDTAISPVLVPLSPRFVTTITSYIGTVTNAYKFIGLDASANDAGIHSITVNNSPVTPNTFTGPAFYLNTGSNSFTIVATAGDLVTKKTYNTTIFRLNPAGTTDAVTPVVIHPPVHWITTQTNLGLVGGATFTTSIRASGTDTTYSLIAGTLPPNLTLQGFLLPNYTGTTCLINGSVQHYPQPFTGTFVVRAYSRLREDQSGNDYIADKTFSIDVRRQDPPIWFDNGGPLDPRAPFQLSGTGDGLFIDRDFMSYQMTALPTGSDQYTITYALVSGFHTLPNGLELSPTGTLEGIINTDIGLDYINTFTFAVAASDGYLATTQTFVMYVINANSSATTYAEIGPPFQVLQAPEFIGSTDLGVYRDNSIQFIPVTAYDPYPWMGVVTYSYNTLTTTLPYGLSLDPTSGILAGYIPRTDTYSVIYDFEITATKTRTLPNPNGGSVITAVSSSTMFTMQVIRSDENQISWISTGSLGNLLPGVPSELSIFAQQTQNISPLIYSIVAGSLPSGLSLTTAGNIIGITTQTGVFTPTIVASDSAIYSPQTWQQAVQTNIYQEAISIPQTFKLTVPEPIKFRIVSQNRQGLDYYSTLTSSYNNIYIKPFLPIRQRQLYNQFINNTTEIFIPELLYRADDPNFGIQRDPRLYVEYGVFELNSATNYFVHYDYLDPTFVDNTNYFHANGINQSELFFTDVQTQSAFDGSGKPIYDVVYVGVVDPTNLIANTRKYFTTAKFTVPEWSPKRGNLGSTGIGTYYGLATNRNYTPRWTRPFTSKGTFLPAVILCYALPGNGQKIVDRFNRSVANGGFTFNQLNFMVDRFVIDHTRSSTSSAYLLFGA